MNYKIFAIFDASIKAYMQPFFLRSQGEALRGFTDLANDDKSNICRHASDYTLFEIGEYDDTSAIITSHPTPERIATGNQVQIKSTQTNQGE